MNVASMRLDSGLFRPNEVLNETFPSLWRRLVEKVYWSSERGTACGTACRTACKLIYRTVAGTPLLVFCVQVVASAQLPACTQLCPSIKGCVLLYPFTCRSLQLRLELPPTSPLPRPRYASEIY